MNELIIDATILEDIHEGKDCIEFNISIPSRTHSYTYIKVQYIGEETELIKPYSAVRLYGHLDSELYITKSGKRVFNKVIIVEKLEEALNV